MQCRGLVDEQRRKEIAASREVDRELFSYIDSEFFIATYIRTTYVNMHFIYYVLITSPLICVSQPLLAAHVPNINSVINTTKCVSAYSVS